MTAIDTTTGEAGSWQFPTAGPGDYEFLGEIPPELLNGIHGYDTDSAGGCG